MARAKQNTAPSPEEQGKADGANGNAADPEKLPEGGEVKEPGEQQPNPETAQDGGEGGETKEPGETDGDSSPEESPSPEEGETKVVFLDVNGWHLPVVDEFPVLLHLDNASPSRRTIHAIRLYMAPNEARSVEFSESEFALFKHHMEQIAHLSGWKAGEGLIVTVEAGDAED